MNFQQLRIIRETVRQNYNLTEVANALCTSPSGVSKHIKDLEDELGVELFVRRGKRLLGLTDPGKDLAEIVERMLLDAMNIKRIGEQFSKRDRGRVTVATTHTQARYALLNVVTAFKQAYPRVQLVLHEAGPHEIVSMLLAGEADIGIATDALERLPDVASFPVYSWHHAVVVPAGHPLTRAQPLSLEAIAEYPIITYQDGVTGRARVDRAFANAGLAPDVVMSAVDADVIKTYAELGLGIGIIASMAFNRERDSGMALLDCNHLFEPSTTRLAVRRGQYLRDYVYRFIELWAPDLTEAHVRAAVAPLRDSDV